MTQDEDPKRLTGWELDQLRFSAEQREIVDVAGKDLLALVNEVTEGRQRYTIGWDQVPNVTGEDIARWKQAQPPQHPYATLLALLPIGGVALWVVTGDWKWAAIGLLALLAAAAVGAAIDGAKRGAR